VTEYTEYQLRNIALRKERMAAARKLGRHTNKEWLALVVEFDGYCVRCLEKPDKVEKDHTISLYEIDYGENPSDSIENIQPLCKLCNLQKTGGEKNWVKVRRKERKIYGPLRNYITVDDEEFELYEEADKFLFAGPNEKIPRIQKSAKPNPIKVQAQLEKEIEELKAGIQKLEEEFERLNTKLKQRKNKLKKGRMVGKDAKLPIDLP
jgi:hypothetical protein